ncbi:PaaI family thioesterase [Agrococcus jejuensis]|uniref:Uncharacterized domain 1-containing protein n=1 Tax=Agrococcus jejuensis TaxID=399736 RepID=A0A1G8F2A6_9MICO|nr:PaaI family thioesterase [Agrococcus jejuensis]SDH76242.1 uncharacterized domain 1-containing protein [Agrococcus jejuensis]
MVEHRAEIAWTDPGDALGTLGRMSGLDYLLGVMRGTVPQMPILSAWGIDLVVAEPGRVELRAKPTQMLYNQVGTVHGGFASTLLDTACGLAGFSTQPAGHMYTSMDLAVRFLRPVLAGDAVRAVGEVVKPGRKVIATEARLLDARGRILATATSGLLVLPVDR